MDNEWSSCSTAAHLWVQLLIGDAAGGEKQDGGEGGDAAEQAEEWGPECGSRSLPPLLYVGDVEDAGRRPLGLTEHLWGERDVYLLQNNCTHILKLQHELLQL